MLLTKLEEVTGKKGLKARIEKWIGAVSKAFDWLEKLMSQDEEGGDFWDRLEKAVGSIWDFILDAVVGWLEKTIVVQALKWVVEKLDPTGVMAVITTIIDVYNVITAIMEKPKEIFEMIDKVLDGLGDLIKGIIGAAATVFEKALGAAIPVVMAILSALFGLDGVVDEVKDAIKELRQKVEDGVKKVMNSIKAWVLKMLGQGDDDGKDSIEKALAEILQEGEAEGDEGEVTKDEAESIKSKVNTDHPSVIQISSIKDAGANWEFEYVQKKSAVVSKGKLAKGKHQKIFGLVESGKAESRREIVCRSGTLDARIGGTVGDVMQAHHMISCSVAEKNDFALAAAESGYDINRKGNGILLPSTAKKWNQLKGKKPLHRGGHTQEYYNLVENRLNGPSLRAMKAKDQKKPWTDIRVVEAMADVEKEIETALMDYEVTLSNQDPSLI